MDMKCLFSGFLDMVALLILGSALIGVAVMIVYAAYITKGILALPVLFVWALHRLQP